MLSNFKMVLVRHTVFNCQRILSTSLKVPYSTNVIRSFRKVRYSFRVERYPKHLSKYNHPKYWQNLDRKLITHPIDNEVFKLEPHVMFFSASDSKHCKSIGSPARFCFTCLQLDTYLVILAARGGMYSAKPVTPPYPDLVRIVY